VWFNDRVAGQFVAFDTALLQSIGEGTQRL